jgi:hypothetical protein
MKNWDAKNAPQNTSTTQSSAQQTTSGMNQSQQTGSTPSVNNTYINQPSSSGISWNSAILGYMIGRSGSNNTTTIVQPAPSYNSGNTQVMPAPSLDNGAVQTNHNSGGFPWGTTIFLALILGGGTYYFLRRNTKKKERNPYSL